MFKELIESLKEAFKASGAADFDTSDTPAEGPSKVRRSGPPKTIPLKALRNVQKPVSPIGSVLHAASGQKRARKLPGVGESTVFGDLISEARAIVDDLQVAKRLGGGAPVPGSSSEISVAGKSLKATSVAGGPVKPSRKGNFSLPSSMRKKMGLPKEESKLVERRSKAQQYAGQKAMADKAGSSPFKLDFNRSGGKSITKAQGEIKKARHQMNYGVKSLGADKLKQREISKQVHGTTRIKKSFGK